MIVDSVIKDTKVTLRAILNALTKRLTLDDNMQITRIQVTTPATADEEFEVAHTLGRIPVAYMANVDQDATIYDSRRSEWTSSKLFLKCTATSVQTNLVIW